MEQQRKDIEQWEMELRKKLNMDAIISEDDSGVSTDNELQVNSNDAASDASVKKSFSDLGLVRKPEESVDQMWLRWGFENQMKLGQEAQDKLKDVDNNCMK